MMEAGMCMSTCPAVETDLFRAQFQAKTEWYQKNKGDTGNGGDGGDNGGGDGGDNGGGDGGKPPVGKYPFKPDGPCVEACTVVCTLSQLDIIIIVHLSQRIIGLILTLSYHCRPSRKPASPCSPTSLTTKAALTGFSPLPLITIARTPSTSSS